MARVRASFMKKHRRQFGEAPRSGTWPFSDLYSKRGRKRRFARKRFARDARRRRDAVARRRRGARHASNTLCLSCFARRRLVWSTRAARLAVRVCRQRASKKAVEATQSRIRPVVSILRSGRRRKMARCARFRGDKRKLVTPRLSLRSSTYTCNSLNSVSGLPVTLRSSTTMVYLLRDRDPVGQPASRSVGFLKWRLLIE